jgi:Domain of unknown function (DUF5606)
MNHMEFEKLIAISGQGSLFKIVGRAKFGLVAENLETGKKMPVYQSHQVSTLQDISMFTQDGDVPLREVLIKLLAFSKDNSLPSAKDASSADVRTFFKQVLPEHDEDRVHDADIRKLIKWFNQLVKNGLNEASQLEVAKSGDVDKDGVAVPEVTKAKAPKATADSKPAKAVTKAPTRKNTSMVRKTQ